MLTFSSVPHPRRKQEKFLKPPLHVTPIRLAQDTHRLSRLHLVLVCLASAVLMWLGMSELPGTYDEGLILTAAMRIAAGQVPHQDFYINYGPAELYMLAGLFKAFGQSLAVERFLFAFISGLIATVAYRIAAEYCNRRIAWCTMVVTILWLFGLNSVSGAAMYPVSLLNLVIAVLILPVFVARLPMRSLLAAGVLTGLSGLLRYDTGLAMAGVQAGVLAFAIGLRLKTNAMRLREGAVSLGIYLLGFAATTVPALIYYLSVAKWSAFEHDLIKYPSTYYHRTRNLPMPGIHLKSLDNIAVYLPIVIVAFSLYFGIRGCVRVQNAGNGRDEADNNNLRWHGLLVSFGLLSFVMYFKGLVRVSPGQMYLSILPTLLLIAVLYEHRTAFRRRIAMTFQGLMALSIIVATLAALHEAHTLHKQNAWVLTEMFSRTFNRLSPIEEEWCRTPTPLTAGHCFLPDDDRIQTIEFIRNHTQPTDKLFVGTTRHDKIFANDNITYFATQRLPVTHWSHFDPYLQNRLDIQQIMVSEFEQDPPPYIVLDAEFDLSDEPNDSTKHTGVTLLDDYLHSHYKLVETHGMLSIYKWVEIPAK